jgi:hypothetical protein
MRWTGQTQARPRGKSPRQGIQLLLVAHFEGTYPYYPYLQTALQFSSPSLQMTRVPFPVAEAQFLQSLISDPDIRGEETQSDDGKYDSHRERSTSSIQPGFESFSTQSLPLDETNKTRGSGQEDTT